MNPWGSTWKEKNRFQEVFVEIVESADTEDWDHVRDLFEPLTDPQKWDVYWRLASYTRKSMKENHCIKLNV